MEEPVGIMDVAHTLVDTSIDIRKGRAQHVLLSCVELELKIHLSSLCSVNYIVNGSLFRFYV
jgi:hypothetical protein